jgi:hypothetical protein
MELTKLLFLLLTGLANLLATHVDTFSHLSSLITQNDVNTEPQPVQMIDIYNDKALTQKIISFDNVSYTSHLGDKNMIDGLVFDVSKSTNVGIAKNYFSDKGTSPSANTILIRFTNFNKCEVFSLQGKDNKDIVQMGILDNKGGVSYMALSFGALDKQNKKNLADAIAKACKHYIDDLKKKLEEFWKETQSYWKTKTQVGQLAGQIKIIQDKFKKENDLLSGVLTDKENFERNLKENTENLNKIKKEKDEMQVKL